MSKSEFSDYDRFRMQAAEWMTSHKGFKALCYAPFVSLLFDPLGYARVCCQALTDNLGNVKESRLSEIWNGERMQEIRSQLLDYQFPPECANCRFEVERGNFQQTFARSFDLFPAGSSQPQWPQSMWFSLSNACNLECVQCYGDVSSSIRKRQGLPPLRSPYSDEFFEDLRLFLPHLIQAVFLGGEAFLGRENFRIWEMMIEDGLGTDCFIVTNGTVFDKRVERVLERLPCSISVSLDGATGETVESIRRNASFEDIMNNLEKLRHYTTANGTKLLLSFCLMPQNHAEFPDFLMLADRLGCLATANTVYDPAQFSLAALPDQELRAVLEAWERRDAEVRRSVRQNVGLWDQEVARLRNWLDNRPADPTVVPHDLIQFDKR